jgi:hypothetical protein
VGAAGALDAAGQFGIVDVGELGSGLAFKLRR